MHLIPSKNFYSNHFTGNNTCTLGKYYLVKEMRMNPKMLTASSCWWHRDYLN